MKNAIILLALLVMSIKTYSQEWETLNIDSAVSVKLPKGFTISKKDEKYSLVAVSPWGTILIFKILDNPVATPDIEKDKHLKQYYDDYIKKVRTVSNGAIIKDEKDTLLGELKVKDFTLQIDTGSGVLYRNFRILHANSSTYIFEFLYQDLHSQYALPEKEKFFSFIEVNEKLDKTDQYTSDAINDNNPTNKKYLFWAIPAGLIFLVLLYLLRRRIRSS